MLLWAPSSATGYVVSHDVSNGSLNVSVHLPAVSGSLWLIFSFSCFTVMLWNCSSVLHNQCCTGQSSSSHPVVHEPQPGRSFPLCAGFCAPGFALAVPAAETNNDPLVSSLGSLEGSGNFYFHLDNCFCFYTWDFLSFTISTSLKKSCQMYVDVYSKSFFLKSVN